MESLRQPVLWIADCGEQRRYALASKNCHTRAPSATSIDSLSSTPTSCLRWSGHQNETQAGRPTVGFQPASFAKARENPSCRVSAAETTGPGAIVSESQKQEMEELGSHHLANIDHTSCSEWQDQHDVLPENTKRESDVIGWIKQLLRSMQGGSDMVDSYLSDWAPRNAASKPPRTEHAKWKRRGLIPACEHAGEVAPFPEHLLEGMRLVYCLHGLGISHFFKDDIINFLRYFYRCVCLKLPFSVHWAPFQVRLAD